MGQGRTEPAEQLFASGILSWLHTVMEQMRDRPYDLRPFRPVQAIIKKS